MSWVWKRKKIIDSVIKQKKRERFASLGLVILSVILLIIILVTWYGVNVGNFVMSIESDSTEVLALSIDDNLENKKTVLFAGNLKECWDADYSYIPDDIDEGLGTKQDILNKRYIAYSFYVINTSEYAISYSFNFRLLRCTKNIDEILRVMIIKDDTKRIYAKSHDGNPELLIAGKDASILGTTLPFLEDEECIIHEEFSGLNPQQYIKYTVVLWLDGWDQDETDFMKGGTLQTDIIFVVE